MLIDQHNAADFPPPNLRNYAKAESRGPDSLPALWYEKMAGTTWAAAVDAKQKADGEVYKIQKDKWSGWTGKNKRRVEQRQASYQQTKVCSTASSLTVRAELQIVAFRLASLRTIRTTRRSAGSASGRMRTRRSGAS